jgi:hypothetical protein
MNQKLHVFLIGMLGDNFGSLDNDVQPLLKPVHIRGQSDEMLEIGVAQDTVRDTLADKRTYAMLGDLRNFSNELQTGPGTRAKAEGRASVVDILKPPRKE